MALWFTYAFLTRNSLSGCGISRARTCMGGEGERERGREGEREGGEGGEGGGRGGGESKLKQFHHPSDSEVHHDSTETQ